MQDHPALVALPEAYALLFPLLQTLELPDEHRTTCASCPQEAPPEGATRDRPFLRDIRCCTYQPNVPNFLIGRALRRGGVGADRIRKRISRDPDGVIPHGVVAPSWFPERYSGEAFGKDASLVCPFWVPGPLSCSIWQDRNAVCRSWHCRTTHGGRSIMLWDTVRDALRHLDVRLAFWLVQTGDPPDIDAGPHPVEVWEPWYLDCIARLEAATAEELAAIEFPERRGLDLAIRVYHHLLTASVPDLALPVIHEIVPDGADLLLTGYSTLDRVRVPRGFMAFYGQLVEGVPWREALGRIEADYGITFDEGFIELLWERGLLTFASTRDAPPEVVALEALAAEEGVEVEAFGEVAPPE